MSVEQLTSEALRLPPQSRASLAESLWESLTDPFEQSSMVDDQATLKLALERDQEIESGKVQPISHAELMSKLR